MDTLVTLTAGGRDYPLRRATRDDLPALLAMLFEDQLGATREDIGDLDAYESAFTTIDADPAQLLAVATTADDRPVGMMQITYIPGLARRGSRRAQIESVRVSVDHRGNGLGGAMITWAVEEARRHDCSLVQLTSDKRRVDAHRFYIRLGFAQSHEGFKLHC